MEPRDSLQITQNALGENRHICAFSITWTSTIGYLAHLSRMVSTKGIGLST